MPYQANLAAINRLNRGIKVMEFEPGKRLVVRKKLRFRPIVLAFRIFGSLALLGGAAGFISENVPTMALVILLIIIALFYYFIWAMPLLDALVERIEIDPEKGVKMQRMELFRIVRWGYAPELLNKQGPQRLFWAESAKRSVGSGKNKTQVVYLEFWAFVNGKANRRMMQMKRPRLSWAREEAEALSEMLETFTDTFRVDYSFSPGDVDDAV